ncbi:unnamed protein product [Hydatigera taeniaeformis]|uniref:Uncharacterized protein n=1 Tax=Hydatigena taeniaeformis TaxID=6205 RepID=A0A3P7G7S6_HYDTA|nr:unnamed protein product [Hydatigera taeniaeformis]
MEQPPQLNFLYSPSGERRFFFDVRNTPYGNRLHISQVTDLHRNVIGIPLESLVTFRNRLTTLIDALKLEDGEAMRETLEKYSNRPRRIRHLRPTSFTQQTSSSSTRQTRVDQESKGGQQHNKMEDEKGPVKSKRLPHQSGTTSKSQLQLHEPNGEGDHKIDEVQESTNEDTKENEAKQKEEALKAKRKKKAKKQSKAVGANQDTENVAA